MSLRLEDSSQEGHRIARVAHELTTPVTLISGSLENLQESLASLVHYVEATEKYLVGADEIARLRADLRLEHRLRDTEGLLQICAEGARRLSHVVTQLRTGGADPATEPQQQPADLTRLIDGAVRMAAHGRQRLPEVVVHCDPGVVPVGGHAESVGQVLLNVVRNAFDALDGQPGGRIDIVVQKSFPGGPGPAPRVSLSICDNGPGIPPELRARIFDEGFSSKRDRGGLGLGLAISRDIVTGMGGRLDLVPTRTGAMFLIEIPVAEDAAPRQR